MNKVWKLKYRLTSGLMILKSLQRVSRSDPCKVGDEVIVANYERKLVTKHDVSKPQKTDDKPPVPEAGKSEEETDSSNINSGNGDSVNNFYIFSDLTSPHP